MKFTEIIREEFECFKRDFKEEFKKDLKGEFKEELKEKLSQELNKVINKLLNDSLIGIKKSYSEATKEGKKKNVIIVRFKTQSKSETTKKLIKEKVDIKNMAVEITKFKKGTNGKMILDCETGEDLNTKGYSTNQFE